MWQKLGNYRDCALLFFRIAFGTFFIWVHGWPKLEAGPKLWAKLGASLQYIGIDFLPTFWGFMAAFSESVGVLLLVLGLWFRPACVLLLATLVFASVKELNEHGIREASHAIELAILMLTLTFVGPGRFSIDKG